MATLGHAAAAGSQVPALGSRGREATASSIDAGTSTSKAKSSSSKRCPHIGSRTKQVIDRLKVLVPYANVCQHRQALLQGRRGAQTATMGSSENREPTPAPTTAGDGDRSRKRLVEEMPSPSCFTCHTPVDRLHVCLSCDYFGCWRPRRHRARDGVLEPPHIVNHLVTENHQFALDFVHLQIYCSGCADYIYEPAITSWLMATYIRWHAALCDSAEPEAKRPRIVSTGSDLSPAQTKYLKEHGTIRPCAGIRGLYNLGATCYLSVVLQALIHNPLMRGWMLSDGHHPSKCRIGRPEWVRMHSKATASNSSNGYPATTNNGNTSRRHAIDDDDDDTYRDDDDEDEVVISGGNVSLSRHTPSPSPAGSAVIGDQARAACMACELESSFQAFFSGNHMPYGPVRLLHSMWILRSDLAGYGQQDAHECLMAMLDTLHVGFTENVLTPTELADEAQGITADSSTQPLAMRVSKKQGSQYIQHTHISPCPCLIHQSFAGVLQSTVTCSKCGNVTHAHDPMLDISLDIPIPSPPKKDSSGGPRPADPPTSTSYRMTQTHSYSARAIDAGLNEWLESRKSRSSSGGSNKNRHSRHSTNTEYDSDEFNSTGATGHGSKGSSKANRAASQTSICKGQHPVITLQDCLAHYTRAEQLQAGSYMCSRCKSDSVSAVKQLCIKELPPVLTFQLKRFEHHNYTGGNNRAHGPHSSKVDAFVRLPLHLDMTPYTASALASHNQAIAALKASGGNATTNTGNSLPPSISSIPIRDIGAGEFMSNSSASIVGMDDSVLAKDTPIPVLDGPGGSTTLGKRRTDATHSNPSCQYTLFAVIDHIGQLDTGHYTAYAQHRGQWYLFDDATVTKVDIKDVLGYADEAKVASGRAAKGRAYMAFYVKSVLDYHDGAVLTTLASGSVPPPATALSMASPAISMANTMTSMGVSNTRINESGEWIEDAGVVRTRINPNGDVKVERRGRKKGSTNSGRKNSNQQKDAHLTSPSHSIVLESGEVPSPQSAAAAANAKKRRTKSASTTASSQHPLAHMATALHRNAHEEGELEAEEGELGEYMAQGSLDMFGTPSGAGVTGTFGINPMALNINNESHVSPSMRSTNSQSFSPSSSDSDGEALWARMSKEKAVDDLVPMFSRQPQAASPENSRLYVNPSDLASSPANKSVLEFDDDDDGNSDFDL